MLLNHERFLLDKKEDVFVLSNSFRTSSFNSL